MDTRAKMRTENLLLSLKTQSSPKNDSRQKCLEISLLLNTGISNIPNTDTPHQYVHFFNIDIS